MSELKVAQTLSSLLPRLGDLLAGLSVALIAVPQALAYAELAGMPPHTGLYAVAASALFAAFFVSSPYLQTGPVATTSLLTVGVLSQVADVQTPAYIAAAGLLALVVGVTRLLVGLLRLGPVAYLMSYPVLRGFTSAAAVLIVGSQLPTALGVSPPVSGILLSDLWTFTHVRAWRGDAALMSTVTLAVILLGRRLHPLFPGVLVAVAGGMVGSAYLGYGGPTVGAIPTQWLSLNLALPWQQLPKLLLGGVIIALVGFSEASSIGRTYATLERSRWDANREFVSQGVANVAAGLFGSFPVGGSFSRSSVNRLAGAKTRWSGAVTGLAVCAVLPFASLFSALPKATLGAIVIAAVLSLFRFGDLTKLWQMSRPQAVLGWLTFGLTLALSPRIDVAVLIGIALATGVHLWREQRLVLNTWQEGKSLHFEPHGVLWFGSAYRLEETLSQMLSERDGERLVLHLGGLGRIDLSAALTIEQLINDAQAAGLSVELVDVPPSAKRWVAKLWTVTAVR